MATAYGRMQPFVPEAETVVAYLDRLNLYFEANEIAEAKRIAVFLTVIGPANYTLLRGLVPPANPKDKTLAQLQAALKAHYEPKTIVIAEQFRFYRRAQAASKTIAEFVAALRKLAATCDFDTFLY